MWTRFFNKANRISNLILPGMLEMQRTRNVPRMYQ